MTKVVGLNHLTLAVEDVTRSVNFYQNILGMKPLVKWDRGAYLLAGNLWVCLSKADKVESGSDYTHYAFSVEKNDFNILSKLIIDSGATIFQENSSPGESLYFLDPDGHKLELHCGSWQDRIQAKKQDPGSWLGVEWYV